MSHKNEKGINNCFANVFIHGVISNITQKELKNNRSLISLTVCIDGNIDDFKPDSLMSEDIEVIVNNKRLMQKVRNNVKIGTIAIIKGSIIVKFTNSSNSVVKKFSYISVKDLIINNPSDSSSASSSDVSNINKDI